MRGQLPTWGVRALGAAAVAVLLAGLVAAAVVDPPRQLSALGARTGFSPGAGLMHAPAEAALRELDAVVDSGAGWIRLDIDWSVVEPAEGQWDWSGVDRVVGAARERQIEVLALLSYTPAWARPAGTSTHAPPDDPAAFAAFAGDAAARLSRLGVSTYEIWNEPNLPQFWEPTPSPEAYTQLLLAASAAVHRADPDAVVLTGGLAPASDEAGNGEIDPRTFLRRIYALGAGAVSEGAAVHPYSFPATPTQPGTEEWNTFLKLPAMRATMEEYGDAGERLWLTEVGAPTGTDRGAVDEQRQATIVLDVVREAAALPWTGPVLLYAIRDAGDDPEDLQDNFGLLRRDFTEKPAWDRLRQALR